MTAIAAELEQKLQSFDPETAAAVERLVRDALLLVERKRNDAAPLPPDFWQTLRADWGDEPFERPPQGEFEKREAW